MSRQYRLSLFGFYSWQDGAFGYGIKLIPALFLQKSKGHTS